MLKKTLLFSAAASAVLVLSGCSTTSSTQKATNEVLQQPHEERQYRSTISRANNIALAFGFGLFGEGSAPESRNFSGNGSVVVDSAAWAGNLHSAANSAFLPGTSSWGAAAGWGIGIGLASALLGGGDMKADSALVGYLPKEVAKDSYEARLKMLEKFSEVLQKSLKAQYPDAEFRIKRDDYDASLYIYELEMKSKKLNCKFSDEASWHDIYNPCSVRMSASSMFGNPGLSAPLFGKQFDAWRFFAQTIKVRFHGGNDLDQGIDWAKAMAATAPFMPENLYLYVATIEGPRPKRLENPPFFVEKDKVDFFVRPRIE